MSSYQKRAKSLKRTHRERGQLSSRKHLGLLEKHKDYVQRAKNYKKKKDFLKVLHEKARNKNPDEFYYPMVNKRLQSGRHVTTQKEESFTAEQLLVMKTQDIKYVEMKERMEEKKIERLRSSLHLIKHSPCNSRTVFVDSMEEVETYNSIGPPNTTSRNRITVKQITSSQSSEARKPNSSLSYRELNQRIHRHRELKTITHQMRTEKHLMGKGERTKVKGDGKSPRTYIWKTERKR